MNSTESLPVRETLRDTAQPSRIPPPVVEEGRCLSPHWHSIPHGRANAVHDVEFHGRLVVEVEYPVAGKLSLDHSSVPQGKQTRRSILTIGRSTKPPSSSAIGQRTTERSTSLACGARVTKPRGCTTRVGRLSCDEEHAEHNAHLCYRGCCPVFPPLHVLHVADRTVCLVHLVSVSDC